MVVDSLIAIFLKVDKVLAFDVSWQVNKMYPVFYHTLHTFLFIFADVQISSLPEIRDKMAVARAH